MGKSKIVGEYLWGNTKKTKIDFLMYVILHSDCLKNSFVFPILTVARRNKSYNPFEPAAKHKIYK